MLGTLSVDTCNFYLVVQLYAIFCAISSVSRFIVLLFSLARIFGCNLPVVLFVRFKQLLLI